MNQEFIDLMSVISSFMQGLIAFATILLSVVIWRSSSKVARAEYTRSIQDSWINSNITVLQSERLCRIAFETINPNLKPDKDALDDDFYTKRYMRFMYLNIIETVFIGREHNLISNDFSEEIGEDLLKNLLRNPATFKQVENGGFSSSFVKHCKILNDQILTENTKE